MLELLHKSPRPTVAFCMGDLGTPSRLLGAKFGAPFTYAAFNKERGIAPGLLSLAELKRIYHYDQINLDTKVFGVLGDPVGHSLSPLVHNMAFRHLGINAVYVPFRVPRPEFADSLKAFMRVPVQGYSITIPHKEEAAELAKHKDDAVARTRAANTLLRSGDDFSAYNTDFQGIIATLRTYLPTSFANPDAEPSKAIAASLPEPASLQSKVVLVLGAGGIGRAVAHALRAEGALVSVANRTSDRAATLAEEIGGRHIEWQGRHSLLCDVVVNCTSVGMHPDVDEAPLHPSFLKPGLVVFDTVYTPETTLLVKEAAVARLSRHHRRRAVRPPGRPAIQAVHPARAARRADAQGRQTRLVAGGHPRRGRRGGRLNPSLLALIGPRGSGKSTVARLLAEQLGWAWLDADDELEKRYGQSIRAIFSAEGEAGFRDREAAVLAELCRSPRHVLATGGGVVLRESNRALLRTAGRVVWLSGDVETLWRRVQGDDATAERRPALTVGGREEIAEILRIREPLYRSCADLVVETADRAPAEIAAEILRWMDEGHRV